MAVWQIADVERGRELAPVAAIIMYLVRVVCSPNHGQSCSSSRRPRRHHRLVL